MKILLVEDIDEKAAEVQRCLQSSVTRNDLEIDRANSVIAAVRKLEHATYDLLVLDLNLPIRDGEAPTKSGGKDVLAEIVQGRACRRPSHIICLTAYGEAADSVRDEADRTLVHIVLYEGTASKWRESLQAKTRYVEERLKDSVIIPADYKIDLVIVTSSPLVELREVKQLPGGFVCEHNQLDALDYYSARWRTVSNREIAVIACAAPRMGMTAACVTACKAIARWRPHYLVMTGLAAATTSELHFGDVLVADAALDYGSGKILDSEEKERAFRPSPHPLAIDTNVHAILQRWEQEQLQMNAIRMAWEFEEPPLPPRLVLGILATGAAVVQSRKVVDDILSTSRKIVGLDMEAYAIFQAGILSSKPRPRVVVAKSITDFADNNKSDRWQRYAAFTSARFSYEFFTNAMDLYDYPPIIY